jgi:hypothetical protein
MALGTTTPAKRGTPSEARRLSAPRDANGLGPVSLPGALLTPKMQPAAQTLQTRSQVGHRPPGQACPWSHLLPERLFPGEILEEWAGDGRIEARRYGRDAVEQGSVTACKSENRVRHGEVPAPHS